MNHYQKNYEGTLDDNNLRALDLNRECLPLKTVLCQFEIYDYPSTCKCKRNPEFIKFFPDLPGLLLKADVPYSLVLCAYRC